MEIYISRAHVKVILSSIAKVFSCPRVNSEQMITFAGARKHAIHKYFSCLICFAVSKLWNLIFFSRIKVEQLISQLLTLKIMCRLSISSDHNLKNFVYTDIDRLQQIRKKVFAQGLILTKSSRTVCKNY